MAIHFIEMPDASQGIKELSQRLSGELENGQHVLWLVPGGSNIDAVVKIMESLPDEATKNLTITLTDERYGSVGHVHSNAKQLLDAGFTTKQAVFIPVLMPGFSLIETRNNFEETIRQAFEHADVVIGQFGIGADGHIAGILPNSEAVDAIDWTAAYAAQEFTRITLTFSALRHMQAAYAFVFGNNKKPALERLRGEILPLNEQPSQILKEIDEAYVFNDQLAE